ncbi:MAG: hypothetical protein J5745_06055 [Bacteroidales bacterium]|nr:hypothetical protein [Bacteroidales bacterium]
MKAYRFLLIAAIAVAAVAGCRKHDRPQRQNGGENGGQEQQGGGREQQVITLKENKTWSIEYGGRQTLQGAKVEVINVSSVPANTLYLVSVINRENYSTYEGDLKSFMEAELENALQFGDDYIYTGSPETIYFDPFRHGTWYAFVIALDSDKKVTGEYAYKKFEVEEEEPTEDFLKWIGDWSATDGRFVYNLKVTSLESNFMYRVDGWEVFTGAQEQMTYEYLETYYDGGRMYFVSQFIQSYEDEGNNNVTMEECFLGEIDYDGILHSQGIYLITDEGLDLAVATLKGATAVIEPCIVTTDIDGEEFEAPFYDMKYFAWNTSDKQWYHYNDETIGFPITMTRVDNAPAPTSIGRRGAAKVTAEKALRGKVHKAKTQRSSAAVRVK